MADLSIAGLKAHVEETSDAILSGSRRIVHDKTEPKQRSSSVIAFETVDLPFALSSVLLDDGFAGFNLTKTRCPAFEIFICGVGHEASDVDIGDAFRILETFGKTEFFLVGPECWNSTGKWRITGDQFVKIGHLV